MKERLKILLKYFSSYLIFIIWVLLIVLLFLMYWNDHKVNMKQESDLLTEIRKSNQSMKETEEFRPRWSKLLKDLEDRQYFIISELNELQKMKEQSLKHQDEIIEKLDKLLK